MSGRSLRPLFPGAVTLSTAAVIFEGDGRPALYLGTMTAAGHPQVCRVPEDATVTATLPPPPPTADKKKRVFLPDSRVTFETPTRRAALTIHTVRAARELLEALEAYGEARQSWQSARAHFEGTPQGAA